MERVFSRRAFSLGVGLCMAIAALMMMPAPLQAQTPTAQVSGTVTEAQTGEPLPGVNVVVKGTTVGTATGAEGSYELEAPSAQDTLVFTFVGYQSREEPIDGRSTIDVELASDVATLDEAVVVGYGTQRKSSVSSAVSEVSEADLAKKEVTDPRRALQGIAPGVSIVDRGGAPGQADIGIQIRGNTTIGSTYPLILVNGIEQDFSDLNPNNIESISVLKDAAATAIYGSRAANGVVLVTTKDPRPGELQVSYTGYYGVEQIAQTPEHLGLEQTLRLQNEAYRNQPGGEPFYTEEEIQTYLQAEDRYRYPMPNTFFDAVFRPGPLQNHSLAFSGGTEQLRARLSMNYVDQEGIIPNFGETRKEVRLDTDFDVSDRIGMTGRLTYRRKDVLQPSNLFRTYRTLLHASQFTVPKYPDGTYGVSAQGFSPLVAAELSGDRRQSTDYLVANFRGNIDLLDNLRFTTQLGGHVDASTNSHFANAYTIHDYYTGEVVKQTNPNSLTEQRSRNQRWTLRSLLNYDVTLSEHGIELLGGFEQMWYDLSEIAASRDQFYNNDLRVLNAGSQSNWGNSGEAVHTRMRSAFARAHYTYADKYIFEANARYDGSSRFAGSNNQYGFFPSFSAAWRLSEENFWEALEPALSEFKLRASWGRTGSNTVDPYTFFSAINLGSAYSFGGELARTAEASATLINPDLTWETTTEWDIGLDAELWQGLFGLTFDVYKKRTEGILLTLPIPDVVGLGAPPQNAGRVDNTGWELALTHRNFVSEDFDYVVKANLSNFHNEVIDLARTGPFTGQTVTKVGEPLNALWGYEAVGYFESEEEIANYPTWAGKDNTYPGDLKYTDLNEDGLINENDKTVIGYTDPHYTFGVTTDATFKNFDMSLFVQGVGQQDRIPTGAVRECGNWRGYIMEYCGDYWTPENTDARVPRRQKFTRKNNGPATSSSWWVIDASYLKLKNVQIGYTLPSGFTSRLGINRLRAYVSGTNLLTISEATKYGMDPEVPSGRFDYYPQTTLYSVGIDLQF